MDDQKTSFHFKEPYTERYKGESRSSRSQSVIVEQFQNSGNNGALSYYKFVFDSWKSNSEVLIFHVGDALIFPSPVSGSFNESVLIEQLRNKSEFHKTAAKTAQISVTRLIVQVNENTVVGYTYTNCVLPKQFIYQYREVYL